MGAGKVYITRITTRLRRARLFDLIFTCEYMMSRVAVVTGSNKGVGYGIIRGFCKNFDGDVYLTARDVGRGEEAVAALKKEGLNPKFHQLDISNDDSIKTLAAFLKDKYGGVDVFVNNAAIAYKAAATEPFAEQAEVSMDVNFFNTLNVCKNILPITKTGARVVHVASMAGPFAFKKSSAAMQQTYLAAKTVEEVCELMKTFVASAKAGTHEADGYPNTAYGMSKLGVCLMTPIQQAKIDSIGKKDVVINSCCPGYVNTDMSSGKGTKTIDQGAETPLYLALLPPGVASPRGEHVSEKQIKNWRVV